LGNATLDNTGTATLTTTALAVGSHPITAVYAGDSNFTGSTSSVLNQAVQDFQLVIGGTSVNDSTQTVLSATVVAGQVATYQFQLSPSDGATFPNAVTLSLSGLPPGATYTLPPSNFAGGSAGQTVTVQVFTARTAAGLRQHGYRLPAFALGLLLLPMMGVVQIRGPQPSRARRVAPLLWLLLLTVGILGMAGCGGGGTGGPAGQTYTMQLSAASGALQHVINLSLTVQ
jgi:hypothetical protein